MFKRHCIAFSVLAFLSASVSARAEEIEVFASDSSATKCYLENGEAKGFMLDVLVEALKSAGFTPKVKSMPFKRALEDAKNGTAILACAFKNAEREKSFVFSDPIGDDEVIAVTLKGKEFPIAKFADLKGKKVGYLNGGSLGQEYENVKTELQLDLDNDANLRLKKLEAGRVDVILLNPGKSSLAYQVQKLGMDLSKFSVVATLKKEPNYAGVSKNAPNAQATIERLNKGLKTVRANGTFDKILKKYGF